MHHPLKTEYNQHLSLTATRSNVFWYGLLLAVLLLVPVIMDEFYIGELGGVFIFAIAGVGAMLLTGYTGLINLCQAAILGIGAYTNAVLLARGVPFVITLPLSGFLAAIAGVAIGVPT